MGTFQYAPQEVLIIIAQALHVVSTMYRQCSNLQLSCYIRLATIYFTIFRCSGQEAVRVDFLTEHCYLCILLIQV